MYEDSSKWLLGLRIAAAAALQTRSEKSFVLNILLNINVVSEIVFRILVSFLKVVQWGIIKKIWYRKSSIRTVSTLSNLK